MLAATAELLGQALAIDPHGELAEAIAAGAEAAAPTFGPTPTPAQLVEVVARAHGVLDLADTADTILLAGQLARANGADLILTPAAEAAYQRTVDRFNTMWADRSGLDRFLY